MFQVKGDLFVDMVFFVKCSSSKFGSLGTGKWRSCLAGIVCSGWQWHQ